MSITFTLPATIGDAARLVSALAEPCLVAAAALAGAGPLAQALVAGTVRVARGMEIEVRDSELRISFG